MSGRADGGLPAALVTAAALSPPAALAWLRSLSTDVGEVVLIDASGAVLAGDAALAARAATALGDAAPGPLVAGDLVVARSARHTAAAAVGPRALRRLVLADLRAALAAVEGP